MLSLTACTSNFDPLNSSVAAADLDLSPAIATDKTSNTQVVRSDFDNLTAQQVKQIQANELGLIVRDSEQKCDAFLSRLSLGEVTTNSSLSVLTTVSAALGAVFTPLAVSHAFSAAAAITSGSRTDIDTNIYESQTIDLFAKAIKDSYYTGIGAYQQYLDNTVADSTKSFNVGVEVGRIEALHAECSLASAEASINAALKATPPAPNTGQTTTTLQVTVTGTKTPPTTTDAEAFTLSGKPATGAAIAITKLIEAKGNTAAQIAQAIAVQATTLPGITATTDSTDNTKILIQSPAASDITWTPGVTPGTNVTFVVVPTPSPAPTAAAPKVVDQSQGLKAQGVPSTGPTAQAPLYVPGSYPSQ